LAYLSITFIAKAGPQQQDHKAAWTLPGELSLGVPRSPLLPANRLDFTGADPVRDTGLDFAGRWFDPRPIARTGATHRFSVRSLDFTDEAVARRLKRLDFSGADAFRDTGAGLCRGMVRSEANRAHRHDSQLFSQQPGLYRWSGRSEVRRCLLPPRQRLNFSGAGTFRDTGLDFAGEG